MTCSHYRCLGVVRGGSNGAPNPTPNNIQQLDLAVFQWKASAPNFVKTDVVRIRCDNAVDPARVVRLPGEWKDALTDASLKLAKSRFSLATMDAMGPISATEHADEALDATDHRCAVSLECSCLPRRYMVAYKGIGVQVAIPTNSP